jgi:hypothetical protein
MINGIPEIVVGNVLSQYLHLLVSCMRHRVRHQPNGIGERLRGRLETI